VKLKPVDYLIFFGIFLLAVFPDPLDVFDAFLPVIEGLMAGGYYIFRGGLKK